MSDTAVKAQQGQTRTFPPPDDFRQRALINTTDVYEEAEKDWQGFWARQAGELLSWFSGWEETLEWALPYAKWFAGGKLNASYNCLDRHVESGYGGKVAYYWEGEPGDTSRITYGQLHEEVCRFANALKALGVQRGDRVAIYMPLIPELPVAMLACARIGAPHLVVFSGFSSDALRERISETEAKVLVTADGGWRKGKVVPLKAKADLALADTPSIERVVVVARAHNNPSMEAGRDHWYHELLADASAECPPEQMDAEDLLFLLYTSGTTAKPKGIMHSTGGYLTQVAWTHKYVFDLHSDSDVYWSGADIGWITGHSYGVYGPLLNRATSVMYEGTADYPAKDRIWQLVERYQVSIFYSSPTTVRTFMKWGNQELEKHDLSSLRLLGSFGEPLNPEAWLWYWNQVGGGRCPIVDTWWQTETGAMMIAPLPGVTTLKPGSAALPLPGVGAEVVDNSGVPLAPGTGGHLTIDRPWPAMLRGIYGNPERYWNAYWSRFEGRYVTGDGCRLDDDGYYWLLGRVDDVMNVSGHRISTTEVESTLMAHEWVAEAAVVGAEDETTGQAIIAFVTLREDLRPDESRGDALRQHVAHYIGPFARPKSIIFTGELPKTRSGKMMRRLLRDVAEGRHLGDTTSLADATIVDEINRRALLSPQNG